MSDPLPHIVITPDELGEQIAVGRTSTIHAYGSDRVLKLLNPGWKASETRLESHAAQIVSATALATPQLFATATVGDRHGLIYERVEGPWLIAGLDRTPESMEGLAVELATLHAAIHRESGLGLPPVHDKIRWAIERSPISSAIRNEALKKLDALPRGDTLLHMDLHPYQIIRSNGRLVVLDWVTASQGAPAADVARTAFMLSAAKVDDPDLLWVNQGLYRSALAHRYVNEYCRQTGVTVADIEAWFYPLAAARRGEVDDENPDLIAFLENGVDNAAAQPFMRATQ